MVKALLGITFVGLLGYIGYSQYGDAPLDSRDALDAGIEQLKASEQLSAEQEQLLRVQLALADFISLNKGEPPESLDQLVPRYFDKVPLDPSTNREYEYAKTGSTYKLGAQISAAPVQLAKASTGKNAAKGAKAPVEQVIVNPNEMELEEFTYDPTGKRDPFEPFDFSPTAEYDPNTPPLQRYSLGQLRVTAILADSKGVGEFSAIVEDATGRGYTVRKGTAIGNQNGVVVSIEADKINVVETFNDFTGKETKTPVVMRIPPRGGTPN